MADLLHRAETDPAFLMTLAAQCRKKRPLFRPARETAVWRKLLRGLRLSPNAHGWIVLQRADEIAHQPDLDLQS